VPGSDRCSLGFPTPPVDFHVRHPGRPSTCAGHPYPLPYQIDKAKELFPPRSSSSPHSRSSAPSPHQAPSLHRAPTAATVRPSSVVDGALSEWTAPSHGSRNAIAGLFPPLPRCLHADCCLRPRPDPIDTFPSAVPAQHCSPSQPSGASTAGSSSRHQCASSIRRRRKPILMSLRPRFRLKPVPCYLLVP
jgi:hypothetical protein